VLGWLDKIHRPKDLKPGEVVLYSKFGQTIKLDEDGQIVCTDSTGSVLTLHQSGEVHIAPSAGITKITGSLEVSQSITAPTIDATSILTVANISVGPHTHSDPQGGSVGPMQ
jgi:phage gp45-like